MGKKKVKPPACRANHKLTHPYKVINEFYDRFEISDFLEVIREMMLCMYQPKAYSEINACYIMDIFEVLSGLFHAAYTIHRNGYYAPLSPLGEIQTWGVTTTALTAKESRDPYRVFRDIFRYQPLKA